MVSVNSLHIKTFQDSRFWFPSGKTILILRKCSTKTDHKQYHIVFAYTPTPLKCKLCEDLPACTLALMWSYNNLLHKRCQHIFCMEIGLSTRTVFFNHISMTIGEGMVHTIISIPLIFGAQKQNTKLLGSKKCFVKVLWKFVQAQTISQNCLKFKKKISKYLGWLVLASGDKQLIFLILSCIPMCV